MPKKCDAGAAWQEGVSAAEYDAALPLPLRGKVTWFKNSVNSAQGAGENPLTLIRRWMYYRLADMDVQSRHTAERTHVSVPRIIIVIN